MKSSKTRQLVLSGLFIAIGVLLPVIFHMFGLGSVFLPMHLPVLMAGFLVDVPFGILVGAITPILSSLITGMPPAFPVLPYMVFELATYGGSASLFYRKLKFNIYISLIFSMVLGRVVSAIVVWILATFFMAKLPGPFVFIAGSITKGLPGIVIQLILIPILMIALERYGIVKKEEK